MREGGRRQTLASTPCTRRQCLGGLSLCALAGLAADEPLQASRADVDLADAVRKRLAGAGLKNVGSGTTEHYLGVGDAPAAFRGKALKLCEDLASTFLKHFKTKGFELAMPRGRLGVVALADRTSYAKFKGVDEVGDAEGGHYDVDSNLLAVFDFLDRRGPGGNVRRVNTFTLVHEAVHQLTYNTGLLDRRGDVPLAVSEGLATYGELWQLGNPRIGQVNGYRLDVLTNPPPGAEWVDLGRLLTEDKLFDDMTMEQQAYAESWLLIYELMQSKAGAKKLLAYLQAIRPRRDPGQRVADAEGALGDLTRLDNALKKRARLLS